MDIRLFAMDVDGTMTDGKIYIGPSGEAMKAFSVKDGMGIALLHKHGIKTAIITGRKSEIVALRAKELKISYVYQGIENKLSTLAQICDLENINLGQVAFIGDDINDLEVLRKVGLSFSPNDAVPEVIESVSVVVPSAGGDGAVRNCAEYILSARNSNTEMS